MRANNRMYLSGSAFLLSSLAAVAIAAPPRVTADPRPVVDGGVQVRAPAVVVEHYERMRERARPPVRPGFLLAKGHPVAMTAKGTLVAFADGAAMLSVPVTAQQREVLKRVGAKEVRSQRWVRHHTLFEGNYYRELKVAPPAGHRCAGCADDRLVGPDPRRLKQRVGKGVTLALRRDRDGRAWVVDVRN